MDRAKVVLTINGLLDVINQRDLAIKRLEGALDDSRAEAAGLLAAVHDFKSLVSVKDLEIERLKQHLSGRKAGSVRFCIMPLCVAAALALVACSSIPRSTVIGRTGASVTQSGEVKAPALLETTSATVRAEPPASVEVRDGTLYLTADSTPITVEMTGERLAAAATHEPPTPAQTAQGFGVRMTYAVGLALVAAGGVLAWMTHKLAALFISLGGAVLMLFGAVLSSAWAVPATVGLVALGGGLVVAWYILKNRFNLTEGK